MFKLLILYGFRFFLFGSVMSMRFVLFSEIFKIIYYQKYLTDMKTNGSFVFRMPMSLGIYHGEFIFWPEKKL